MPPSPSTPPASPDTPSAAAPGPAAPGKADAQAADHAAPQARQIQAEQDAHDRHAPPETGDKAQPAPGPGRDEPAPPLPRQHLRKPGLQAEMELQPRTDAPHYHGSGKLRGCSTLITGGDSGIGRAVAVLFAREGANVGVLYLDEHEDAQETKRLVELEGARCIAIPGDVRDADFCRRAVDKVVEEFGPLDVLVNNAAFQEHAEDIADLTAERLDTTFRTNVFGYFHMAQAALAHMRAGACILNTGSVTGLRGSKKLLDYSATKGAIHAFTKALAAQVAPRGIRVNAIAPGPVWTPLNPADQPPEAIATFGEQTDLGRPAQPEEIAPAYVFLAAPSCASYITGIVLPITGSVE